LTRNGQGRRSTLKNVKAGRSFSADDRIMMRTTSPCALKRQLFRRCVTLSVALLVAAATHARALPATETVTYPEDYRAWLHVKTALVSARHPDFARSGGFRHIYANPKAAIGYRTGSFAEGSIIVVDWIEGRDDNGMFTETVRKRLDVMVKDPSRFSATGGWGWERFNSNSRTERMVTAPGKQCFECHAGPGTRDSVFSTLRE